MIKRQDLRIRDPYVFVDKNNSCYYLYGSINLENSYKTSPTFWVYKSYDLESFEEPKKIFDGQKIGFWADQDYWAPELHEYNGKYYLFASFKAEGKRRACQILVGDKPDGEFSPLSNSPITLPSWDCLDGTFFVDGGKPYMVFCHEWVQINNGEICAVELSTDLSCAVGEPFTLFKASDNPFVSEHVKGSGNYVTDGPFLYREDNKIKMIWSSFKDGKYAIFGATSNSIFDKWQHFDSKFDFCGGHAMLFTDLKGQRFIALHTPNKTNFERAIFYKV